MNVVYVVWVFEKHRPMSFKLASVLELILMILASEKGRWVSEPAVGFGLCGSIKVVSWPRAAGRGFKVALESVREQCRELVRWSQLARYWEAAVIEIIFMYIYISSLSILLHSVAANIWEQNIGFASRALTQSPSQSHVLNLKLSEPAPASHTRLSSSLR